MKEVAGAADGGPAGASKRLAHSSALDCRLMRPAMPTVTPGPPSLRGRGGVAAALVCLHLLQHWQVVLASSSAAGGHPSQAGPAGAPRPRLPVLPRFERDRADFKLLFVDNALFANLSGDIGLRRHRPSPAGQVVLRPDKPWESFGMIGYHTVVQMGPQDYRMYYDTGWTMENRDDFHRYTCLATSTNGVDWVKPSLGVATFNGSKDNNIVWPLDWRDNTHAAGTVFYDTNPAAPADEKWKMVAQWNIDGVNATTSSAHAGVYMMASSDGVAFRNMFDRASLSWSDTKNVMWWEQSLKKYVAYIRLDVADHNAVHPNGTQCAVWPGPGRRIGRCLIGADQLHDWSAAGCNSAGSGSGVADVLSFDKQDPSCLDIYTNSATEYERVGGGGSILFFPSAYQHIYFPPAQSASKNNDGLLDIRFATARRVLDNCAYPPTRDGRAPYVPLGANSCPILTMAPRTWSSKVGSADVPRFDWCYNDADDLSMSAIDTGTKYMASGYLLSSDGAEVMLYSGGDPESHGGGGIPVKNGVGAVGSIAPHSGPWHDDDNSISS
eukprot:SAG22_NODE_375_length_11547_cov_12.885657_4_plen_552_part_00